MTHSVDALPVLTKFAHRPVFLHGILKLTYFELLCQSWLTYRSIFISCQRAFYRLLPGGIGFQLWFIVPCDRCFAARNVLQRFMARQSVSPEDHFVQTCRASVSLFLPFLSWAGPLDCQGCGVTFNAGLYQPAVIHTEVIAPFTRLPI